MSALLLASARLSMLRIPLLNYLLDRDLCKKIHWFPYFIYYLFQGFNHDFIKYIDITHITVSKHTTDNVKIRSHIQYFIQTLYSCAHFEIKTDEKSSLTDGFSRDVMTTLDSGRPCICRPKTFEKNICIVYNIISHSHDSHYTYMKQLMSTTKMSPRLKPCVKQ